MISFFRKPKRLFQVSDAIFHCVKMLLLYRMKNHEISQAQLIANGADPDFFEEVLDTLNQDQLSSSKEYYIIYLIAVFITLQRKAGKQFSYKDIVYTVDQKLPKPEGHIPVEMWAPDNYPEYIKFRLTIDFDDSLYPNFVIDDLYEGIFLYLSENFYYDKPFQL